MRPAGRLGVGVIGAGRVGPVLGAALAGAGHALVGIAAVSQASRDRAEAMLPAAPILAVPDLVERSELVLLAVPDDELPLLVQGLAEAGVWVAGQLVVHTAPGLGTGVLLPAVRHGAIPVALSPAMAFTGTSIDVLRLREARCAVTAPGPVLPIGQALAVEMGCEPVVVAEEDRAAWAQALDDVVGPVELAVRSAATGLARLGVADPDAVLGPIARTALDRALLRAGRLDEEDDPR
ncbi:NAD(P)-binding domain-containing protein [Amnibacterium kyonggiense]